MSQLDSANQPANAFDPMGGAAPMGVGPVGPEQGAAGRPGVETPVQKQRLNVYTMMLVISFIAMTIACILMYLELEKYGTYPWWDTKEADPVSFVAPQETTAGYRLL